MLKNRGDNFPMTEMNICLACDNTYAKYAGVAISALLKNSNPDDYFNFYILDNNISEKEKKNITSLKKFKNFNIEFVCVDNSKFENLYLPPKKGYLSISAYYRFVMPSLFTNIDKILYIDCDVIATTSIKELYNTDITGKLAAVIKDTACEANQKRLGFEQKDIYFNSGVFLANLEEFRKQNIQNKLFETIKEGLDDQDILNIVLKGNIVFVDNTWNYQGKAKSYKEKTPPKLIHYITAYKPWLTGSKQSFNNEYFKALKGTPWDNFYEQHLRRFLPVIHKDRKFVHLCLWGIKTRVKYKNV